MHHNDTSTIGKNINKPARNLARGLGYITIRKDKTNRNRYQARWLEEGKWKSRTFGTYRKAEECLVKLSPPESNTATTDDLEGIDFSLVYFIQADIGGLIKIGRAKFPSIRIKALQAGSPVPLRILAVTGGGYGAELHLHRKFDDIRAHGEWFYPKDSLLDWIKSHATTLADE